MATLRAFKDNKRIATARCLKDGQVFQAYPVKQMYSSEKEWHEATGGEIKREAPKKRVTKWISPVERFRNKQASSFLDHSYSSMFKSIMRLSPSLIRVNFHDGNFWEVELMDTPFHAPKVWKNGELVAVGCKDENWSPALAGAPWLITVAFVTPD